MTLCPFPKHITKLVEANSCLKVRSLFAFFQRFGQRLGYFQCLVALSLATLLDRDRQAGSYAYTVNVYEPSTGRKGSVDPTIENQPD